MKINVPFELTRKQMITAIANHAWWAGLVVKGKHYECLRKESFPPTFTKPDALRHIRAYISVHGTTGLGYNPFSYSLQYEWASAQIDKHFPDAK